MKTSLVLIVAATLMFAFTQAADAQCGCQQSVSYYAPISTTTYYYAPTVVSYAPTAAYYYPTTGYYTPTTAYYGSGYYGSGYGGYGRGGLFGTGVSGWAGLRGMDRRWDRRMAPAVTPY